MERGGIEEAAVERLTSDIEPASLRSIVAECLRGNLASATALCDLIAGSDLDVTRCVVDQVTHKAATISRSGDNLVRDRADDLTQLFIEAATDCESGSQLLDRLRAI